MLRGLLRCVRRGFTSNLKVKVTRGQVPESGPMGIVGAVSAIKAQFDHAISPGPARHSPHTQEMSETELFDEDAHEVQAMVVENAFDLDIMGGDVQPQRNFGTVDNPVLMFSSNVGWRYVMCSGMNDEDEGSSHQGVWFILREGPTHRCPSCGQCFKLINLKDEISEENDYYAENYAPILEEEMGDDDDMIQRWSMHNFAEPYPVVHPHQNTEYAYILVNADDHDRILTDPAYRLQRLHEGHEKLSQVHHALMDVEQKALYLNGGAYPKVKYTREDYEDLITTEKAIRKLDRIYEKVERFNKREVLDPDNHTRREFRMKERASKRVGPHDLDAEFQRQYKDYYESDQIPNEDQINEQEDYEDLVTSGIFNFKNYEFVQEGTSNPIAGVLNTFDKKLFRFRHRQWNESPDDHFIREVRMKKRFFDRLKAKDPSTLIDATKAAHLAAKGDITGALETAQPYREYVMNEAVQQYKDYYESDVEDLKDFEHISPEERAKFAVAYTDFSAPLKEPVNPFEENFLNPGEANEFKGGVLGHWKHMKESLYPKAESEGIAQALGELHLAKYEEEPKEVEGTHPGPVIQMIDDLDELLSSAVDSVVDEVSRPELDAAADTSPSAIKTQHSKTQKPSRK